MDAVVDVEVDFSDEELDFSDDEDDEEEVVDDAVVDEDLLSERLSVR